MTLALYGKMNVVTLKTEAGSSSSAQMKELIDSWINSGCSENMTVYVPRRLGASCLLHDTADAHTALDFELDVQTGLEALRNATTQKKFVMGTPMQPCT